MGCDVRVFAYYPPAIGDGVLLSICFFVYVFLYLFLCLFHCQQDYEKTPGPICIFREGVE